MKYFLQDYWVNFVPLVLGVISIILAALHYNLIDDLTAYRRFSLLPIEIVFVIANFMWGLALIITFIKNLFIRDWKAAAMNVVGISIAFVTLSASMALDSPTLIYAT